MNNFLRGAACAPLLALVAGCCANNANNCDDLLADSLYFTLPDRSFNADTVNVSFTRAELDTVYLQRYTPARAAVPGSTPATAGAYSDPVSIIRKQQSVGLNSAIAKKLKDNRLPLTTLIISNNSPFSPSFSGGKLNAYSYLLTVQDRSVRPRKTYSFAIDNIVLKGQYHADGCNTCYENTAKSFRVNNGFLTPDLSPDVTETGGVPIVTTLSKKEAK
jgi:hypothetical protein